MSAMLRRTVKPLLRRADVRRVRMLLGNPHPASLRGVALGRDRVGGVAGEWVAPLYAPRAPVLLYLHGGGYVACSPRSHRPITAELARRGFRVFAPDYRLAPEAPFPAGLEDALAVYRALRAAEGDATAIVLAGDSAGGGLALALMLALRDAGDRLPSAAVLFSPLADLVSQDGSRVTHADRCAFFDGGIFAPVRDWYLNGADARNPLVSPVFADLHGLPPLLVHVGRDELLLDDSTRLVVRAREAGVDAQIVTWPAVPHVWQIFPRLLPEARASLDGAAAFFQRVLHVRPDVDVLVVGSGFAGLGMAIRLQQAGRDSFLILERGDEVGGTWRDNTYPGCACDVPSHLYSFSFETAFDWSRIYASQGEIQAYLLEVVARHDLRRKIRFGCALVEARFDEKARMWRAVTSTGDAITARVIVSGVGGLNRPFIPALDGADAFAGPTMHTAAWNHDVSLDGKRVAVVGSAASAIQAVPVLASKVSRLTVFQRTPSWVMPRRDRALAPAERRFLLRSPRARGVLRALIYGLQEMLAVGFVVWPGAMRLVEWAGRRHIARSVSDPVLREKLTPTYRAGCKRILTSNDFYPAVTRDHVEVVTEAITGLRAEGVVTADGRVHEVDAIVYATGFRVTELPFPVRFVGRGGIDLNEVWRDGMQAHHGVTVAGFPNLFLLIGPNTGLGHNSIVFMIEAQVEYVLRCLAMLDARGARVMETRASTQARYNDGLQRRMARTVWATGCHSWYQGAQGRITTLWPGFTFSYWARLLHPRPRHHEFE